jgi:hypothetical protein
MNKKETAILHYKEALKLLPGDADSEVTPAVRQRIETISTANLKKME